MQLRLKPVSHPELGDIVVRESLFAVGRDEVPFAAYRADAVRCLSRRHARLFNEGGEYYIADLGSTNGTTVNGDKVAERPARLTHGDRICFGGHLSYLVEFPESQGPDAQVESDVHLTLVPVPGSGIEPIAINRFPFLVSKGDDTFSKYTPGHGDEVNYLSRRHAHVFLKEGMAYVEDLGSTNGTWVNGTRLDEHARLLSDGDEIAFGGEFFRYTVRLQQEGREAEGDDRGASPPTTVTTGVSGEGKTTFVESANSFLDIFCTDEEQAGSAGSGQAPEAGEKREEAAGMEEARPGYVRRKLLFFRELRGSFSDSDQGRSRGIWIFLALLIVAAAVATGVYLSGKTERELHDLMAAGQYEAAAIAADSALSAHPDDSGIRELATEALMKHVVPNWGGAMRSGDHAGAMSVLDSARSFSSANPAGLELVDLLEWMTDIDAFVVARGGLESPIAIYVHEEPINDLIDRWEADDEGNRRRMRLVHGYHPGFADLQAGAYSALRELRSERSVYLAAIGRLHARIEEALASDRTEGLSGEIARFADKYPRVSGIERLQADLRNYEALKGQIAELDLMGVVDSLDGPDFQTPPFQAKVEAITRDVLPPPDITERYRAAFDAWLAGDTGKNRSILEGLTDNAWSEVAERELARNRRVAEAYERLRAAADTPGYDDELIAFHAMLDGKRDVFFLDAIEGDMQARTAEVAAETRKAGAEASAKWEAYRKGGGIPGIMRLEDEVSEAYRRQAGLLSAAHERALAAYRLRSMLGLEDPESQRVLREEIDREVRLQRLSLDELGMVLNPSLLREKLALLPQAGPQAEGAR